MTNFNFASILCLLALPCLVTPVNGEESPAPRKYAFIVGVEEYDKGGLQNLSYSEDDA